MREVNIKQLRDNLSKELKDLPVWVTRDGQIVATIVPEKQYLPIPNCPDGRYRPDSSH